VGRKEIYSMSIGIYKYQNKIAGKVPETNEPAHWIEIL